MASTFTTNKSIEKPSYNDFAANPTGWTTPVNSDWDIIDAAFGGVVVKNPTGLSGTIALSTSDYQKLIIVVGVSVTSSAVLTANITYTIPFGVGGNWIVYNNTTGAYTVTVAPASGGGSSVVIQQGVRQLIYSDGTNVSAVSAAVAATGSNNQVIYNSSNTLVGSNNLTFDGTTLTANTIASTTSVAAGSTVSATTSISAGTSITAGSTITAAGSITAFSDRSLKKNVSTIEDALQKVNNLRGVSFEMISNGDKNIGVIAQEVQAVIPEVVLDNNGILSVAYGNLVAVLIEAVKELSAEVKELKSKA